MRVFSLRLNPIVKILTFSDVFLWGGYNMVNALLAIYLEDKIQIDPIQTISVGVSVYLISRSLMQIPIASVLDKYKSHIDEVWAISIGCFLAGICIYMFLFISQPWHLYLIQSTLGLAIALNLPAWRKTMAKYVDKGYEALEYTIYDIVYSLFTAVLAVIGGYIVNVYGGFETLFVIAGTISIAGAFITLYLLKNKRIQHEYK